MHLFLLAALAAALTCSPSSPELHVPSTSHGIAESCTLAPSRHDPISPLVGVKGVFILIEPIPEIKDKAIYQAINTTIELKLRQSGIAIAVKGAEIVNGKLVLYNGPYLYVNINYLKNELTFCANLDVRCYINSAVPTSPGATAELILWEDGAILTGPVSGFGTQIQEVLGPLLNNFCNEVLKANQK